MPVAGTFAATDPVEISGGETITSIAVAPITAGALTADAAGRPVLALTVAAPGDFSTYTLTHQSTRSTRFCPPPVQLQGRLPVGPRLRAATAPGPAAPAEQVPIDYLAKDFTRVFRQALSEFSAPRYPDWLERSEADLGVVLMEALAALADELSYYQDRVAAEATITTATQRLSVLRHARLVDYEPTPATAATTTLQLDVSTAGVIETPLHCQALASDSTPVDFEVGAGLADPVTGRTRRIAFPVDPRWNRYSDSGGAVLTPYWWDDSERVLPAGATELSLLGHGLGLYSGQQLLLDSAVTDSADPPMRELVTVAASAETTDSLLANPVTLVSLAAGTALDHDLASTGVAGNLLPAIQGLRQTDTFFIPGGAETPAGDGTPALVRVAANWTPDDPRPDYRYCLTGDPLAWIPVSSTTTLATLLDGAMTAGSATLSSPSAQFTAADVGTAVSVAGAGPGQTALASVIVAIGGVTTATLASSAATSVSEATIQFGTSAAASDGDVAVAAVPELTLTAQPTAGSPVAWRFVRSLLSAAAGAETFTLTPERYAPVLATSDRAWYDYDGDAGTTVRFGDSTFGLTPAPGTVFTAVYRVGAGADGNVAADTIVTVVPGQTQASLVRRVTNPFAAAGGADAETLEQIARSAPQAFATQPLSLVRPADYVAAAQSLPFIAQAGSGVRWTGSWLSARTIADPSDSEQLNVEQLTELTELLDRRRLAGGESYVLSPRYASIDLALVVCAAPTADAGTVQSAVTAALSPGALGSGFFAHDHWSFGAPLQASALLAAVQACPGVAGVLSASYRRRGVQSTWAPLPDTLTVAADQILRLDDDPSRPDAGVLAVAVEGGR